MDEGLDDGGVLWCADDHERVEVGFGLDQKAGERGEDVGFETLGGIAASNLGVGDAEAPYCRCAAPAHFEALCGSRSSDADVPGQIVWVEI